MIFCRGQGGVGLFVIDKFRGTEIWRREIGSLYTRNPLVDGERVYVIKDSLYCFEAQTGTTIWNYPVSGQITPSFDDSCVYVSDGGMIYEIDKLTGSEKRVVPAGRSGEMISIFNHILIVAGYESIVAVNTADGTEIWNHEILDGRIPFLGEGVMAISDELVVYDIWENSELEGELRALDINSGTEVWRHI